MLAHPLETRQQIEENEEREVGRNISSPEVSPLCSVIFSVEEILHANYVRFIFSCLMKTCAGVNYVMKCGSTTKGTCTRILCVTNPFVVTLFNVITLLVNTNFLGNSPILSESCRLHFVMWESL